MHPMLQKHVDSGYMKEEHGLYIEQAIEKGETLIISGHRSAGIRPFMAAIMAVVKGKYKTVQVKDEAGCANAKDVDYILVPALTEENCDSLVQAAFNAKNIVTYKETELKYSMMKIMKVQAKQVGDLSKVVNLIECRKINMIPHLINFSRMTYDEKGKVKREDLLTCEEY
ncbi:hypothetical protein HMPREF3188_00597 [Tissierellia bacterium KA00581]|jgi:hypothetical protein|nr:hypothetical protein HMPREF3188_00597 [Tissierellia bacterium KA00581]